MTNEVLGMGYIDDARGNLIYSVQVLPSKAQLIASEDRWLPDKVFGVYPTPLLFLRLLVAL